MGNIKDQILNEVGALHMVRKPLEHTDFRINAVKAFLNSKETRFIPADKKDEIFGWTPTVLFPQYEEFYRNLTDNDTPDGNYTDLKDGFGVSELFADTRRYIVTADYLKYARTSKKGFYINVYGIDSSLISQRFYDFTNNPKGRDKYAAGDIPECQFSKPQVTAYDVIGDAVYLDEVYIESCQDAMAVLAIDLPYKYYATQNMKGNIFTWDITKECYQVGGKNMYEVNMMIDDIATNGFITPLVMRINEGCLTPIDNDTAIKMFIATYLNLPTIPTILYMSDDDGVKNEGYEELHECSHSDLWHNKAAMDIINNITKPYFFFEVIDRDNPSAFLQAGTTLMHRSQYPTMNNAGDPNNEVLDHYLDTKAEKKDAPVLMTDAELAAKMESDGKILNNELQKKVKAEEQDIYERILRGEFEVKY